MVGDRRRGGFTFVEFLVAIGIIAILVAIFLPYLLNVREMGRRTECAAKIGQIGQALAQYARDSGGQFPLPEVVYDSAHQPAGYVAFTGADDGNPFAKDSAVKPNDITASLWLLVRRGYLRDPGVFVCPSSSDEADRITNAAGMPTSVLSRGNFRHSYNLSYSYASPFTDAYDFAFTSDRIPADFALLADKNPGYERDGDRVLGPARTAPPFELARGNSLNHGSAGQNVLYGDGHFEFRATPYCGVAHDNIYTAVSAKRLSAEHPQLDVPGYMGADVGAAYSGDSYLVPTAEDRTK